MQDITERKAWETRQRFLLSELSHSVKNTLAVVQSMARQTFRQAKDEKKALESFEGRLGALSSAHELMVSSNWKRAQLESLARRQLGAQLFENAGRLRQEAPAVMLPADIATPFGLLLHELGTNALKYGALSGESGTVSLTWHLRPEESGPLLEVIWLEQGGPAPDKIFKPGFGSYLIENGLPRAQVKRDIGHGELSYKIELPFARREA